LAFDTWLQHAFLLAIVTTLNGIVGKISEQDVLAVDQAWTGQEPVCWTGLFGQGLLLCGRCFLRLWDNGEAVFLGLRLFALG